MLTRSVYVCLVGLVGALFVHLAIVFLVPLVAPKTAWAQIRTAAEPAVMIRTDGEGTRRSIAGVSPQETAAICRYDLAEGVFVFSALGDVPYWSLAVHSASGEVIFSANSRTAGGRRVDMAVLNASQLREFRQQLPDSYADRIIVSADNNQGFVMLRVLRPDPSWRPAVDRFLDSAVCMHELL
jgi:uncharacterized membrane protein